MMKINSSNLYLKKLKEKFIKYKADIVSDSGKIFAEKPEGLTHVLELK